MKKIFAVVASLFLAHSVFAQGKLSFSDSKVSGEIPAGWEIIYIDSTVSFYIFAPEKENDSFRENITVTHEQLPSGQKYTTQLYIDALLTNLKVLCPDLEVVDSGKDWIIYNITVNGIKVRQYGKVIIKKNNATFICASADPNDFDNYKDLFNEIVASIK